jgi:glycosyltransferase involved in cell wall biosynthesis
VRIAHVADSLEVGGAEIMLCTLARAHRAEGHQVSVHCLYAKGPLADQLRREGISVYEHGPSPIPVTVVRLWRSLRACRPQVVHCHNAAATIYGAPLAWLVRVRRIICTRHSLADRRLFRQEMKFWIAARLWCRTVVAVSQAVRESIESNALADPRRVALIRNGAAAVPSPAPERRDSGLVLVNVARLTSLKDHLTLLRAAVIAKPRVPDLKISIVGDGERRKEIERFIAEKRIGEWVRLHGEQGNVGPYLAAADVFVLSSKSEGLPISLLEAMASGLPAISTNVGGIPEVAAISGACVLVPPSDPQALSEAICRASADRAQLPELGARARQCYTMLFQPERMARDYIQAYSGEGPESTAGSATGKLLKEEPR